MKDLRERCERLWDKLGQGNSVELIESFAIEIRAEALEEAANKLRERGIESYNKFQDRFGDGPHRTDLCNHEASDYIRTLKTATEEN